MGRRATMRATRRPTQHRISFAVVVLLAMLLLVGTGSLLWLSISSGPSIGGPFTLENDAGSRVTDRDFHGRYMLVYFGYTHCTDVCPTTLNAMADALDKLGAKSKRLAPVFITIDPERDTPAVMKRYTAAFSPALAGLTGTQDQIAKVAHEYRVYYAKHVTGPGANDYSMDHSPLIA